MAVLCALHATDDCPTADNRQPKANSMSYLDPIDLDEEMQFEVNLNIRAFVRAAVKDKMDRDAILLYLYLVSRTPSATEKMRRFAPIAQEEGLSRNEILVWLHVSYGGSMEPRHISRKLRIPPKFVENALTTLEAKGIIRDGYAL